MNYGRGFDRRFGDDWNFFDRYRFGRSVVRSWIQVMEDCDLGRCGRTRTTAFLKEPKLVVRVTANYSPKKGASAGGESVRPSRASKRVIFNRGRG